MFADTIGTGVGPGSEAAAHSPLLAAWNMALCCALALYFDFSGLGIGRKRAASGFRVIAIARGTSDQLETALADADSQDRGSLRFRSIDLTDIPALPGLVKSLRAEFGPIHGLVNDAGIGMPGVLVTPPSVVPRALSF